jgi:hypothetical protein
VAEGEEESPEEAAETQAVPLSQEETKEPLMQEEKEQVVTSASNKDLYWSSGKKKVVHPTPHAKVIAALLRRHLQGEAE